jgi:hypothetical protein
MTRHARLYSRRNFLGIGAALAFGVISPVRAGSALALDVYKDPNCGCCTGWVAHLRQHGFLARVTDTAELAAIKARLSIPNALMSCHTAQFNNYVIEGHVPAHAIQRLLAEKPDALGLAVPGMPIGSPGMEGGEPEIYDVILFGKAGEKRFGRDIGNRPL